MKSQNSTASPHSSLKVGQIRAWGKIPYIIIYMHNTVERVKVIWLDDMQTAKMTFSEALSDEVIDDPS